MPPRDTTVHREAITAARAALADPARRPRRASCNRCERDYGNSYTRFVLAQSLRHREAILQLPLAPEVADHFARLAEGSHQAQHEKEATDTLSFETYRQLYLAPVRLNE